MIARLTGWLAEPVPRRALRLAEEASSDHLSCWRLRNLRPDPDDVERLARDWLAGRSASGVVRSQVREDPLAAGRNIRPDLSALRLRDPVRFDIDHAAQGDAPDVAYARGDHPRAARGYLAQLRADPARLHAWTGLGVATDPRGTLSRRPDLVYALYGRLAHISESTVNPLHLADWLDRVSVRDLGVGVQV